MATNGVTSQPEQLKAAADAPAADNAAAASSGGNINPSKDEVGWYFVEQYYTTLSKSPEKLHLFYSKNSQFVYGREAEVANISVGRQAIQQRIKQLEFQDCKVRVSNVDAQATFESIVIQVIGETSNNSAEPKKFVQTFVLAQQPSGYFVLNDILRYINDEPESEAEAAETPAPETETEAPAEVAAPETETEAPAEVAAPAEPEAAKAAEEPKEEATQLDADVIDEKLEEVSATEDAGIADKVDEAPLAEAPKPEAKPEPAAVNAVNAESTAEQLAEEDAKEPEVPKDPSPTPAAKPAAAPAAPAEPAAPSAPMSWSRIAASAGPKPVIPLAKTPTPSASNQARAPAPAAPATSAAPVTSAAPAASTAPATSATPASQPPAVAPAAAAAPAATPAADASAKEVSGWLTAGSESKRQNRPQSMSQPPAEKEGTSGYVKYVTDKVQEADLRNALAAHGELTYFDINRQKNCAFVEYKTTEGYQAALAANPHTVNGENIVVEPRRPKPTAYGGSSYGSSRGGASGRGRGGFDGGNRSGGQGSRSNFAGQGRGRGGLRGRGGAQASNA